MVVSRLHRSADPARLGALFAPSRGGAGRSRALKASRTWVAAAALCVLALTAALAACATYYVPRESGRIGGVAATANGLSGAALGRLVADMDPAMLALARRHDPIGRRTDYWGRPVGWGRLEMAVLPTLGLAPIGEDAKLVNALKPFSPEPIASLPPFVLNAAGVERAQALRCLTQAVYFEAALEPLDGRRAVAQTILNRMRHPGYPKSVCGVVYQGAARTTGCQFSFTCDGSLAQLPRPDLWREAEAVARQALSGYVYKPVGTATHYHADYVLPYWAASLVKLTRVGAHIFYRWTGPSGGPRAFVQRYGGGETRIDASVLNSVDSRIQGSGLAAAAVVEPRSMPGVEGQVGYVAVPDPTAPGGQRLQMTGTIGGRRIPTPEEVARINAVLDGTAPESSLFAPPTVVAPVAQPPPPAAAPAAPPPEVKPATPPPRQRSRGSIAAPGGF